MDTYTSQEKVAIEFAKALKAFEVIDNLMQMYPWKQRKKK